MSELIPDTQESHESQSPPTVDDLTTKLEEAKAKILESLQYIKQSGASFILYVRQTGLWLDQAFRLRRLRKQPQTWVAWLAENFSLSRRRADEFRYIARHWDDPRLVEARNNGTEFDSVNEVLAILRDSGVDSVDDDDPENESGSKEDSSAKKSQKGKAPSPISLVVGWIEESMGGLHDIEQEELLEVFEERFMEWFDEQRWEMVSRLATKYPGCYEEVMIDEFHELKDVRFVEPALT
jgi:hypothetical protein